MVLTIVAQLTMPWLMTVINIGFLDDPARFKLAVILTQITMPYLPCMAVASLLSGVLNGKLLSGEAFDTLVDPRRDVPEAGTAIHGVTQAMVRGQPTIAEVLPAFHTFASDTVLVGHNVAFDLRFFALKEATTGVRFDQPLLDTLLLASLAWPNEGSHGLEVIAGRLGVVVAGRHTALGDARATAEVFLGLLPLLREHGIETFGQAREASRKSYYASLRY